MKLHPIFIIMRVLIGFCFAAVILTAIIDPKENMTPILALGGIGLFAYQVVKWLDQRITALESQAKSPTREESTGVSAED